MGFKYWYEGLIFIFSFSLIIAIPCVCVVLMGTKMINELGNFPTKSAKIQTGTLWKLFIIEIIASCILMVFYKIFAAT